MQLPLAPLLALLGIAAGVWAISLLIAHLAVRHDRRRQDRYLRLHQTVEAQRRELGLDPFPSLEQAQAVAEERLRLLRPSGLPERPASLDGTQEVAEAFLGVMVVPDEKFDPEDRDVFIMGEFHEYGPRHTGSALRDGLSFGSQSYVNRGIVIYWGSFLQLDRAEPAADVLQDLMDTVDHEVWHLDDAEEKVPYRLSLEAQDDWDRGRSLSPEDGAQP